METLNPTKLKEILLREINKQKTRVPLSIEINGNIYNYDGGRYLPPSRTSYLYNYKRRLVQKTHTLCDHNNLKYDNKSIILSEELVDMAIKGAK